MIFAACIGTLASFYLKHAITESRISTRTFYQSVALNLAEAGIDEAMLDVNNAAVGTSSGYRAASDNSSSWVKTLGGPSDAAYQFDQGHGQIHIRIDGWTAGTTSTVTITASGTVNIPTHPPIHRQIQARVQKRTSSAAGLLTKGNIQFNGNVSIDAYDSAVGPWNSTSNRTDQVIVATTRSNANLSVGGNSSIYGYVATAGTNPIVGANGRVYGASTPNGVKIDPNRVRKDFSQNIPDPTPPAGTATNLGAISASITLPRTGDTPVNGRYLYTDSNGGLSLTGNKKITITGPVDIILGGSMQMAGNAQILLSSVSGSQPSLRIYGYQGIQVNGNGILNNTNSPTKIQIFALSSSTVQLSGNAAFTGIIYAPNSDIQSNGNGDISGSITGNSIQFNGNARFHYDVRLGSSSSSPYYSVKSWVELTDSPSSTGSFKRDNRDPFTSL